MTMLWPRVFSSCSSGSGYAEGSMPTASKHGVMCSIISKCFITRSGDMATTHSLSPVEFEKQYINRLESVQ